MAAFGFSAGDFLAAVNLVKDLIQALSETSGAKTKYQDLMSQLYTLERALTIVKALDPSTVEHDAVMQAVDGCQQCISNFLKRVKKYQPLSAGNTSVRDQVKKVQWALCHEEDVKEFKESLGMRTQSLMLMMNATDLAYSVTSTAQIQEMIQNQTKILSSLRATRDNNDKIQNDVSDNIKKLILAEERRKIHPIDATQDKTFEVRPFKLTGAPLAPAFVERSDMMRKIEAVLLPVDTLQQTVLVLQGLGGIWKSQLAREYAARHNDEYSAIFWINAMSESSLKLSMAEVARRIGLKFDSDLSNHGDGAGGLSKATSAVLDWLNLDRNSKWLLIFDNVDSQINDQDDWEQDISGNTAKFFDASPYLPSTTQGTLLITTRLSYVARQFGGVPILVDRMSMDEGLEVISKLSKQSSRSESARAIVERLGAYPIALNQAGRFLHETQTSYESFLKHYETSIRSLIKQQPSKREYQNGSIKVTLKMSFDALKDRDPSAAALLILFGYFNNVDIFHELLSHEKSLPEECYPKPAPLHVELVKDLSSTWLEDLGADEVQYRNAVRSLLAFSFIGHDMASESVSIHPVVHEWILSLSLDVQHPQCAQIVTHLLANKHSTIWRDGKLDSPKERDILSRLRPHVDRCMSLIDRACCQSDLIPGDLVLIGTYYMYQYEDHMARKLIDVGFSLMNDGMLATKVWFYMQVLRMYYEGGWLPGEDRIAFICRMQDFVACTKDPSAFTWVGGKDALEEQLFGALFVSYVDEKMYSEALKLTQLRLEQVEAGEEAQYSIHSAKVCQAWAMIEIGAATEAIELAEACGKTMKVWEDGLPVESRASDRMFDHPELISKDLFWVLGKGYTALGQQERGEQYLNRSLVAYGSLRTNNIGDLSRVAHTYNDNQSLKRVVPDATDRWYISLHHIGQKLQYPPHLSHFLLGGLPVTKKSRTKLNRVTADVLTAVRAREGTDFYKSLVEKNTLAERIATANLGP